MRSGRPAPRDRRVTSRAGVAGRAGGPGWWLRHRSAWHRPCHRLADSATWSAGFAWIVSVLAMEQHDVVIIGGGVAGLAAAVQLGRVRRSVVVVDAGVPRNAPATHLHSY